MKQLRPYQAVAVKECWYALKKNNDPVLLMASVGAGKSLMLANILLTLQKSGKRALCIVNNAELVRNNCATFNEQGGEGSIYCAALGCKDSSAPVVFGTPQSILNGINKKKKISKIKFNIIVVDEAHAINYLDERTCFMQILRYYRQEYPEMRLLGATGTDFRFKGNSIVGPKCLFKTKVGNITTDKLIKDGYLVKPTFEVDDKLVLDFSHVKLKSNGQFDHKQLETVVERSARLTELICHQVVHIMETQARRGVFFFATTKKHAFEILSHLPPEKSAIILGETPQHERTEILENARNGKICYLVNIAIISVGVDIPSYDTIAYLRPTESLVLLVQTMGRALRLSPQTEKTSALVLDFAGNIERHRDWDNPILLEAVQNTIDKDKPLVISCPSCLTMNTEHARRCIGMPEDKRCDYYFEFKECPNDKCDAKNDIAARLCHACQEEIIDPNEKLSLSNIKAPTIKLKVLDAKYSISGPDGAFNITCAYNCIDTQNRKGRVFETFSVKSEKSKRMFYGQFVRHHCVVPSIWYNRLHDKIKVQEMLVNAKTPSYLMVARDEERLKVKKKVFY